MKKCMLFLILGLHFISGYGQQVVSANLPISTNTKLTSLITTVKTSLLDQGKKGQLGMTTSQSKLYFNLGKKKTSIVFEVPNASSLLTSGIKTRVISKNSVAWDFDAKKESQYKLYIANASDSAQNFMVYSGYIYFPELNKWKLIASFKIKESNETIITATTFNTFSTASTLDDIFIDCWGQRENGSWLKIKSTAVQNPMLQPFSDIDSTEQSQIDNRLIQKAIQNKETDATQIKEGLYYTLMKTSSRTEVVHMTDTVSIYYKGYIMGTDIIFDQTSNETRTFPLGRLIRGWQIGLNNTTIGDKIKLLIPSGLAYGIRTRSPKIPPNSILVFEIETVDAKPKK
jgi:FKBP-type peptidyl-prolyl cis-trans isomerase